MRTLTALLLLSFAASAQTKWKNVDSLYQPLPSSVHVYLSNDSIDGKPNIAYYVIADLKDKQLNFTTDTSDRRRLTPAKFYERNERPLLVVNGCFFSYETNRSLNVVIKDGKLISYNIKSVTQKKADSSVVHIPVFGSAIGINKRRKADVAWIETDSINGKAYASQIPISQADMGNYFMEVRKRNATTGEVTTTRQSVGYSYRDEFKKWKMQTAIGGGPSLLQNGNIRITNNEERRFGGKAINDKHPRTAMGYTKDNKLIILVVQGRFPNIAEGATLTQEAQLLKDLGCIEALNLDGGGSSCLLVNGKETIKPCDKEGQRPVPAVFLIKAKK
jgi:exopolysaccharide biosynthesis protein